mmetsp:Transcript_11048/g.27951  ORF Transcript_11048/g.27951 Transcript_11048/m.27951 type:complete len:118 (+) Transcript_11048:287-640(+)
MPSKNSSGLTTWLRRGGGRTWRTDRRTRSASVPPFRGKPRFSPPPFNIPRSKANPTACGRLLPQETAEKTDPLHLLACSLRLDRDSVAVYDALHKAGLQYGPAFQLLTNIHVPDTTN